MRRSLLMALALLGCTQAGLVAAEKALVEAGKFTEVFDPKAGEKEPWCINGYINVFLSKDPFHWEFKDQVGTIYAHASEVTRDVDGKWYISHVGWEHGGLSLAPLIWHDGLDEADASLKPGG